MTWSELIRRLRKAGYVEHRKARGSHIVLIHPTTRRTVIVAVHSTKDVRRGLANKILKEAGLK